MIKENRNIPQDPLSHTVVDLKSTYVSKSEVLDNLPYPPLVSIRTTESLENDPFGASPSQIKKNAPEVGIVAFKNEATPVNGIFMFEICLSSLVRPRKAFSSNDIKNAFASPLLTHHDSNMRYQTLNISRGTQGTINFVDNYGRLVSQTKELKNIALCGEYEEDVSVIYEDLNGNFQLNYGELIDRLMESLCYHSKRHDYLVISTINAQVPTMNKNAVAIILTEDELVDPAVTQGLKELARNLEWNEEAVQALTTQTQQGTRLNGARLDQDSNSQDDAYSGLTPPTLPAISFAEKATRNGTPLNSTYTSSKARTHLNAVPSRDDTFQSELSIREAPTQDSAIDTPRIEHETDHSNRSTISAEEYAKLKERYEKLGYSL